MVLYKRKVVTIVRPTPVPEDLTTEIYIIPQTKEWFIDYEEYLQRMDYYHRRKFVCEITGNSCLTFFEAWESEQQEVKDVEKNFPEALREHILRFLQFNRISRIDQLVDKVYLVFKNEYFPGEEVHVKRGAVTATQDKGGDETTQTFSSSSKRKGYVREKVQYSNPADTKYLVSTYGDGQQVIATNQQILRDRNHFTKWLIKTFIKLTVSRSHKVGAPWVVKERFAKKYRIEKEYPEDLKQYESSTPTGELLYEGDIERLQSPSQETPEPQKGKRQKTGKLLKKRATISAATAAMSVGEIYHTDSPDVKPMAKNDPRQRFPTHHMPTEVQTLLIENDGLSIQPSKKTIVDDLSLRFDMQTTRPSPLLLELPPNGRILHSDIASKLELQLSTHLTSEPDSVETIDALAKISSLHNPYLASVQEALECWSFLNFFHSILKLDTFTFDDFVCAMSWNLSQYKELGRCVLLDEIWCAVLSGLISNESLKKADDPKNRIIQGLTVTLPPTESAINASRHSVPDLDDLGSDSEAENRILKSDDDVSDGENGTDIKEESNASRGNGDDEEDAQEDFEKEESAIDLILNYKGVSWLERIRKRNFKDGGWQCILLGVLSLLDYVEGYTDTIKEVMGGLISEQNGSPSLTSILENFYSNLDVNTRMKALHILTSLLTNGTLIRKYLDESIDESVTMRRLRLDTIRDLRAQVDIANKLHTTIYEKTMAVWEVTKNLDVWTLFSKRRHRLNVKGYEMAEYEKLVAERDSNFQKIWNERELALAKTREFREAKKKVESKLTEIDCQRVRLLGKDRHHNRYWWFENNGLPNLHFARGDDDEDDPEPESDEEVDDENDVPDETYLMGKLWVQGPSIMDVTLSMRPETDDFDGLSRRVQLSPDEAQLFKVASLQNDEYTVDDRGNNLKVIKHQNLSTKFLEEAEKLGIKYDQKTVSVKGKPVLDEHGGVPTDFDVELLSASQRKIIEEAPEPLTTGKEWRFYDTNDEVNDLLKWLNPWGKRESLLRKEMLRVKEALTVSITARRKALWLDKFPKEEAQLEADIKQVSERLTQVASADPSGASNENHLEESPLKKRKVSSEPPISLEQVLESGNYRDLEMHKAHLEQKVREKREANSLKRVLEWVNSAPIEEHGKLLYEGADKPKPKSRKSQR